MTLMSKCPMTGAALLAQLEPLHARAYGWALHCCGGNADAAEEVLQIAYGRVGQGRAAFGERAELKTWWFGVVRLIAQEQRRRAFWRLEKLRTWFSTGGRLGAEAPTAEPVENEPLRAALAQLPARQREVLHLVFYQDLSVTAAAEAMRISAGSARQHYERGKARLRTLLTAHEPA
jgi:RNA polymerase sigma-70 factor (ECF subfamily)